MNRFFVKQEGIVEPLITITDPEDVKHITKSLRCQMGDHLEVSDGISFEYEIVLSTITSQFVEGEIVKKSPFQREPHTKVTMYQALPKQGKMEVIIQKSVELGVFQIVPILTEHTVVLDKGRFDKKIERWQKVADEAVKQCRRGVIPNIAEVKKLDDILNEWNQNDCNLFFYENEKDQTLKQVLHGFEKRPERIGILIGPEGGFSKAEVEKILKAGAKSVTMGKTILRVETAATAALAMCMYELEL